MSRVRLSRRTVLRGVGLAAASIPLPTLQIMQDGRGRWYRDAAGATVTPPVRFLLYFFPNGGGTKSLADWTPGGSGAGYSLSPALESLGERKRLVSVLTGLRHTAYFKSEGSADHEKGNSSLLTGVGSSKITARAPSLDQLIAKAIGGQTRFPSLQAVADPSPPETAGPRNEAIAWAAPGQPLRPVEEPAVYFKALFGAGPTGTPKAAPTDPREAQYRRSVLDLVRGDLAQLNGVLGAEDRRRIDQHLTALRELERQVLTEGTAPAAGARCAAPASAAFGTTEERIKLMVRMTATALQCDLTRVAVLQYGYALGNARYPWLGLTAGDHALSHGRGGPYLPALRYKIQTFAYLLDLLEGAPEGARSVLGNSIVLATTDVGLGSHNTTEHPVLLAGAGGGKLQPGRHITFPASTPLNRLLLAIAQRMNLPLTTFGDGNEPLSEL